MKKRIFGSMLASLVALAATAQISNTLSPYSQFGLGTLANQSLGMGRGMGGVGIGLRDSKQPNIINPASYSGVDSLTMVIDMGVSGQFSHFTEGGNKMNRKAADFDYAVALFRLLPKVGATIGIVPYTNIGYNYSSSQRISSAPGNGTTSYSNTYKGSGGFSQAFLGLGWEFAKGVSIGANFSYLWGGYDRTVSNVLSDSYANTLQKNYSAEVQNWKLDLGAQWTMKVGKNDRLTIGATAGIGHKLGADAILKTTTTNTQTGVSVSNADTVSNAFRLPYTFGGGVSLLHKNSLTVGVDYMLQKWGDIDIPQVNETNKKYELASGLLMDRHQVAVGADWIPNRESRRFFNRVHYRIGASYATPYYKIGAQDGPTEIGVSAGFGIPIVNSWNNRTSLNISAQWVHTSAKNLIKEDCFRINIGLTFNERWFAKWKVD